MSQTHDVIIIPGLSNDESSLEFFTKHWRQHELTPVVYPIGWRDGEQEFQRKLDRLVELIDTFAARGDRVSLVGTSAGGSAAINAYVERSNTVYRVVSVCGRLQVGTQQGFRSFQARTSSSQSFAQSVKLCESNLTLLSKADKSKIMTVSPIFGDELVPKNTSIVLGAINRQVPMFEHVLTITAVLTAFSRPIIAFLKG